MYKTIRHGENSLQYTILPQNDDFRLEGKNKSAGSGKKSKNKKPRRRSFFAYLGLLFVCTVIIGAVLVPFLVSAECLPNPAEWFLKTKAAFSKSSSAASSEAATNKETSATSTIHTGNALANAMLNKGNLLVLNKANVGKPVKIINKDGVEKIILKVNKTSLTTENPLEKSVTQTPDSNGGHGLLKTNGNPENSNSKLTENEQKITIHDLNELKQALQTSSMKPDTLTNDREENTTVKQALIVTSLMETLAPTTTATLLAPMLNRSAATMPNVPRASLQSTLNQISNNSSSSTQPTITTRIMQVPLLKSTAKKPAIPPVLVKNLSPIQPTPDSASNGISNLNDIIPSKTITNNLNVNNNGLADGKEATSKDGGLSNNSDWIHTHWPYIDPSTYFQWNVS